MFISWKKRLFLLIGLLFFGQVGAGFVLAKNKTVKMEETVVTATKTAVPQEDVTVKTEVITRQEIEKKKLKSLQDVLKGMAGIDVDMDSGSWGDKGKVNIRGLDSKHVLVLINGHRIYGGHDASIDLQSYPTSMIKRIEVVKGPGSALYGSDAMGGVINIITREAEERTTLTASAAVGSRENRVFESSVGWKGDGLGTLLNYTYKQSDGVDPDYDEYGEHTLQTSIDYELSPNSTIGLKPYYSEHRLDYEDRIQKRIGLNPSWSWKPDNLSSLDIWGSWFNYRHESEDGETGKTDTDYTQDIYELELNYTRLFFKRHRVTLGSHFKYEERDDDSKGYNGDQEISSVFVSDEIDFYPMVLVIGSRLDDHDKWGTEINPKFSLAYHLKDNLKIRGSVGRGFNAPTLSKLYGGWRMGPYNVKPNPNLDPERSWGFDLGADWEPIKDVNLSATLFQNEIDDLIVAEHSRKGRPPWDLNWENVGEARTRGIEFSASLDLIQNLSSEFGYTLLDTENLDTGKELEERAKHKIDMNLGYDWREIGMSAFLEGQYMGTRYFEDEERERLGGYTVIDLVLNKKLFEHYEAFLRVDNILGKADVKDAYDVDGTEILAGMEITL